MGLTHSTITAPINGDTYCVALVELVGFFSSSATGGLCLNATKAVGTNKVVANTWIEGYSFGSNFDVFEYKANGKTPAKKIKSGEVLPLATTTFTNTAVSGAVVPVDSVYLLASPDSEDGIVYAEKVAFFLNGDDVTAAVLGDVSFAILPDLN